MLVQETKLESDGIRAGNCVIGIGSEIRIYSSVINEGFNMIRYYLERIAVCSITTSCNMGHERN